MPRDRMANPFKQADAVLTRDVQIGISKKKLLKAGTTVTVESKENPDDTSSYILVHKNYRGKIERTDFNWSGQRSLFAENE